MSMENFEDIDKSLIEKSSFQSLEKSHDELSKINYLNGIVNGFPHITLILNQNRQIVYCNKTVLKMLGLNEFEQVLGKRPGDLYNCNNAVSSEYGCGTTKACALCGAFQAITQSQKQEKQVIKECRISSVIDKKNTAFDLRVAVSPFKVNKETYSMIILTDISSEKKRQTLERIFFHDVLNTASGLKGFIEYLNNSDDLEEFKNTFPVIEQIVDTLIGEIISQSDISAAETGKLNVNKSMVNSNDFIKKLIDHTKHLKQAKDKTIEIFNDSENYNFNTDRILLKRVLINLVKNAFEAISENCSVSVGCYQTNSNALFKVFNVGKIPDNVSKQLFQRFYSTKGTGRGLGLYSSKLIIENYLEGSIDFESTEEKGTTFFIELPIY